MIKKVKIPIINSSFDLYVGDIHENTKLVDQKYGTKIGDDIRDDTVGFVYVLPFDKGCEQYMLFLPENAAIKIVMHEALHLSWFMLDTYGIIVEAHNHEILAYLQGFITERILKILAE